MVLMATWLLLSESSLSLRISLVDKRNIFYRNFIFILMRKIFSLNRSMSLAPTSHPNVTSLLYFSFLPLAHYSILIILKAQYVLLVPFVS